MSAEDSGTWLALGVAVLSGASALGGVALGGWLESRRDKRRREYEQSIRFHDERLVAYAAYQRALSPVFAAASVWEEAGGQGSLSQKMSPKLDDYVESFWRATLLAGETVKPHVAGIHSCIDRLLKEPPVEKVRAILAESFTHRGALETAIRAELGIK